MGSRRSKHFILSAVAMLGVELVAGQEEVADTTTAYSGGFTTSVPENQEGNSARLQRENLPGKAKTADEIQRLRKPRNYRELPPEQQEETPIDTARTRKKTEEAEEETPSDPLWKKPWFRNTMIGIALAAVAVLLWFLFAGTLGLRNQGKGRSTGFEDETAPEVDLGTDYHSLALRAEQEGDLRAALRFRFLELLRNLHLKGWIKLEPGKTNRQYLAEARLFVRLDICLALTRAYERAWFGRILPETTEYKTLASDLESLIQGMERRPL